jgi:PEP-CTERM putative exosortase interaction domain
MSSGSPAPRHFSQALAGGNELNLYFSGARSSPAAPRCNTKAASSPTSQRVSPVRLAVPPFSYYFANASGSTVYNGLNYYTRNEYETLVLSTNMLITISTVAQTANFGGDDINGQIMQVQVVPEPSTYALLGLSAAAFGAYQWRRRRRG